MLLIPIFIILFVLWIILKCASICDKMEDQEYIENLLKKSDKM